MAIVVAAPALKVAGRLLIRVMDLYGIIVNGPVSLIVVTVNLATMERLILKHCKGHICPQSPGFNLDIKDQVRVDAWQHDFDSLLTINAVPQFNTIRISNDHTSGQKKGKISPVAAVADNDLAIGRFIEHLSQSPIWKESVVFILEDDAQNGPDHIDAHRSPAFVVGPYVKRNAVIHTMYSTSGFLRTMELDTWFAANEPV
jgi:hypothetical protein